MKTGTHKVLAPYDANWLFTRAAAIARHLYVRAKGTGVKTLRTVFGSNERNGTISCHHHRANGKIIRYCLKMLSDMKLVDLVIVQEEDDKGKMVTTSTKGKKISPKGRSEMDKIAVEIYRRLHPQTTAAH